MAQQQPLFTDVQRRKITVEGVVKEGVPVVSVDKQLPGGSTERLMLLNHVDARRLLRALDNYLREVEANHLAAGMGTFSPEDMAAIFGIDEASEGTGERD